MGIDDPIAAMAAGREQSAGAAEAAASKPTEFESTNNYAVMLGFAARLEKAAATIGWNVPPMPVFGTLPLGQLNAMAIKVPGSSEHLVVFQDGAFGFGNLLTKAVAASFPVRPASGGGMNFILAPEEVAKGWAENDEPLLRLADLLAGYLFDGTPYRASQYFLPNPAGILATVLWFSFELFIFGHEFGHIAAGHLERGTTASVNLGGVRLDRVSSNWEEEFEADRIGMVLAMLAMRDVGFDAATCYCGIDLFFSSIELIERAVSVLVYDEVRPSPPSKTHPPAAQRRAALRQQLATDFGEQTAAQAHKMAASAEMTLTMMWERIEPFFKKWRNLGLRPTRVWAYPSKKA